MAPLSLLSAQKVLNILTAGNAFSNQVGTLAAAAQASVPAISPSQIVISSYGPDIADKSAQLTYPRVCLHTDKIKNTQAEKFRSFSGTVAVVANIWASGNLVQQTDQWIHFYVDATTSLLSQNRGDWGDGVFFSGVYEIQFQPPKAGGFGYVQSATVTCTLNVSRS